MKKLGLTLSITILLTVTNTVSLLAVEIPEVASDTMTFSFSMITAESYSDAVKDKIFFSSDGLRLEQSATQGIFTSQVILANIPFSDVGVHWNAETPIESEVLIEIRTSKNNEVWKQWQKVNIESFPNDNKEQQFFGYLIGVNQKDRTHKFIQYRITLISAKKESGKSSPTLDTIQLTFIDAGVTPKTLLNNIQKVKSKLSSSYPKTVTAYPKPPVVSRAGWGCDESLMSWPPEYETVTHNIIHHTDTPNSDTDWAARVRAIYIYHAKPPPDGRGWGDIGYNYLVDPNGVLYEGRYGGDDVIGGHAVGFNDGTMGLAFLGTYTVTNPSPAMINSAEELLAWKCDQRNIDPLVSGPDNDGAVYPYICGHRDVAATECPGDKLYDLLPTIRIDVENLISIPSGRLTLNLDTKYWEYGSYQLRVIVQASPGEVSSITISGPCIDAVTYSYSGGQRCFILDTKEPPRIGQTITFYIEYQDNSSETISKTIDGVFTETPVLVSPPDGSTVNTLTPTFEWRNLSISGLIYSVQIDDINHTTRVYSVYDLPDGTTSHTIPGGYLDRGTTYYWLVAATDANGNEALADWDKLRISSLAGLGYHKVTQVIDTINQGAETIFNYIISETKDLIFALGWEGSTLKLSVYRPDGSLYAEEESSTSPVTISIPKAEAADWRYKITGIDVPYDDYPFVVEIGERSPVASDLENIIVYPNPCRLTDGNATITFKGLTADATIRILSIDGQLINETELIGQVNWTWNVKNQANEDLSRGIYIYLITNSAGEKKIGKIAIIK